MPARLVHLTVLVVGISVAACGGTPATSQAPVSTPAPSSGPSAAPATAVPATDVPATVTPATAAPATAAPATDAPSTAQPGASLDPSLSDAGIVGRVTIPNDTRDERSGTHDIIGREGHGFGTDCAYTFEGDEFIAVAYDDDAQNGEVYQMSVSVPTDSMPANDGEQRLGIANGVAYVDFRSESGFGTAYTGAAERDEGSSSIDVTVAGDLLIFDYEAVTWDGIEFFGQVVCQGAEL
jgi:hypothetical protein